MDKKHCRLICRKNKTLVFHISDCTTKSLSFAALALKDKQSRPKFETICAVGAELFD